MYQAKQINKRLKNDSFKSKVYQFDHILSSAILSRKHLQESDSTFNFCHAIDFEDTIEFTKNLISLEKIPHLSVSSNESQSPTPEGVGL